MTIRRITALVAVSACVLGAAAPAAQASEELGTNPLAAVLTADGDTFDSNGADFDIVTEAALAVIATKPDTAVKVLTDGTVPVTAFIPNDNAFRHLLFDMTGSWKTKEADVFSGLVEAAGVDAIESVLLYHVVPGATVDYATARKANEVALDTALAGAKITVSPRLGGYYVKLRDLDRNDVDPTVNSRLADLNKGNKQIAHAITAVLRPADLDPRNNSSALPSAWR